jgi:hypothetical protein
MATAAVGATAVASSVATPFAQLLGKAAQAGASPTSSAAPSTAAASGAQQNATSALNSFNSQLQQFLAAEGVDTSQPIVLKSDGLGGLELANNHPDASKIKSILAENPQLAAQFASVQQAYLKLQPANATAENASQNLSVTISGKLATASLS